MPAFNENLITDCLRDSYADGQSCDADQAVACDGFELRVNHLMDNRVGLSSDRALQDHANDCLECQQVLQQYQQLELLFGGEQVRLRGDRVEVAAVSDSRRGFGWAKLSTTAVAMLGLAMFAGQYFGDAGNGEVVPSVAIADGGSQSIPVSDLAVSSVPYDVVVEDLWPEGPVDHFKGLVVNSGTELLAAGGEQVSVIRELSEVRLDLGGLESQLESLQPVLSYSGRIPALSSMQGTVCFTLGWLKKDKAAEIQVESGEPAVEVGLQQLQLRDLA